MPPSDAASVLTELCAGRCLDAAQMGAVMRGILGGEWTPAQTAGLLIALKIKGETPAEIAAAAGVMRDMAAAVDIGGIDAVDTCGTGGDGARTFNISTAAAFVAAACGAPVAKHGNRAVSSACGSFDVLAACGMPADLSPAAVAGLVRDVGIGFMFAPNHHAAMRHAMPVRRDLGVRTLFNLLGPLTNPAGVRRQVVGVFSRALVVPYAEALHAAGAERALVVHGAGGLDEVSISGETEIAELKDGMVTCGAITPEDAGLQTAAAAEIRVESAAEARAMLLSVLDGGKGAARDVVLLNAAAALIVGGRAGDFADGAAQAAAAIDSGAARQKLDEFIAAAKKAA